MTLGIGGMGWITPLGSGRSAVWDRLLNGDEPGAENISSAINSRTYPAYRVPADALAKLPAHPRLRRASAISKFAAIAGLAALEDAGITLDPAAAARTAIIFAVANGGVIYTKRFYHEVVDVGAQAASPLLFPETVFNAPASHLAAILGITGTSYTLVGDGAVGILALKMAEDLLGNPALDCCLVVGAEEADWLLCDAYHRWRLLRAAPPAEPFGSPPRGMILSEGAGALLIDRSSALRFEKIDAGTNFPRRRDAANCLDQLLARLAPGEHDLIIASANGTFIDRAETAAFQRRAPGAPVYAPKDSLGESVGASSLWQIICAAQALQTRKLPPMPHAAAGSPLRLNRGREENLAAHSAIVTACGMNQQVAGLRLSVV